MNLHIAHRAYWASHDAAHSLWGFSTIIFSGTVSLRCAHAVDQKVTVSGDALY
ncbi:MAG: hypothetical protein ACI358_09185 [Candidatus Limimorpha sp.]